MLRRARTRAAHGSVVGRSGGWKCVSAQRERTDDETLSHRKRDLDTLTRIRHLPKQHHLTRAVDNSWFAVPAKMIDVI